MNKSYKLPIIVTLFHLPLFFLQINGIKEKPLPKKKISINTISLVEPPSVNIRKQNIKHSKPNKTIKASTKQKNPKKIAKKKTINRKIKKKKIQKAINKSLSKRKPRSKKSVQQKNTPKKIVKKDAGKNLKEYNTYLQEISEILSNYLTLPEQGKVKLAITVRPNGKIVKIVSLSSESIENLTYLQKNLVDLTFPEYKKNEERTFTIVFSDEK